MAIYRQVHMSFWEDTKVTDDFTPEDRYFMLYLLTNTKTNLIGCYEISAKQIAYDMGYSVDSVRNLIERFEKNHKMIMYDHDNREIFIKNWYKYNWNESPKLETALQTAIEKVKTDRFKNILTQIVSNKPYTYPMDTILKVEEEKIYPMDTTVTVTVTDTVSVSDTVNIDGQIQKVKSKPKEVKADPYDYTKAFEMFYSAYPRKVAKPDVKKWFEKNKPSAQLLTTMLMALEKFKKTEEWLKERGKFIPYPATWLNKKRWEDDLETVGMSKEEQTYYQTLKELEGFR